MYFNIFIKWILSVFISWSYLKWRMKFHKSRIDNKYVHESNSSIISIHNTKLFIFNSTQNVKPMSSPWMKHGKTNIEELQVPQSRFYLVLLYQKPSMGDSWKTTWFHSIEIRESHFRTHVHSIGKCGTPWVTLKEFHYVLYLSKDKYQRIKIPTLK